MKDYQPWDESWRKELSFVPWIAPEREGMATAPILPAYPLFIAAIDQQLAGEELWQAVGGSMIYWLGHEPTHELAGDYVAWLNLFNDKIARQLMMDGTACASHFDLPTAVWMLQAALLLNPELVEANYNLGLAFTQLGEKLEKENRTKEATSCYGQAYQYLCNTVELDSQLSMAYYTLGVICRRLGRDEESKTHLERSIILDMERTHKQAGAAGSGNSSPAHQTSQPDQLGEPDQPGIG